MALDFVIRGGTLLDGSGGPSRPADIGIEAGLVAAIGMIEPGAGILEADAAGCYVAPGFIDIHSHSDLTLLVDPRAVSALSQGVTTEVIGNCGHGCAPIVDPEIAKAAIYGPVGAADFGWRTVSDYFARLDEAKPAVNVLALVPNGQLRLGVVGREQRAARPDELDRMQRMLAEGLEQGAFGFSTGLEYAQEHGAPEAEITALCKVAAAAGGIYATHTRNRDQDAVAAVEEAVRTARNARIRLQISHIVPRGGEHDTAACIELVDRARHQDVDVAFDMHTRLFGFTHLKNLLPGWVMAGETADIAARLRDPSIRAGIAAHPNLITGLRDWSRVLLVRSRVFEELNGVSFAEIGRRWRKPPLEAAYDILLGEASDILRPMVILQSYTEAMLRLAFEHKLCMIGSDATTLAPEGALAGEVFYGAYSWASWFYRRMARETGLLTPQEAVARLSALPARTLGLHDRGLVRPKARADIVVFDPARFGECATVASPNLLAQGMVHVFVNGVPTMLNGELTGRRGGMVIRAKA